MFNYINCTVERSETTKFAVSVAPWELPVLAAVNGEELVIPTGETPVRRELPDAAFEYDRMTTKYGIDKEGSGQAFAALVYGVGSLGVARVAEEIEKCRKKPTTSPPPGDVGESNYDPTAELFGDLPTMAGGARAISE